MQGYTTTGSGRASARFFLVTALLLFASVAADAEPAAGQGVTIREERGVMCVLARFKVAAPEAVAIAVLTDYDQIASYMPNVQSSRVVQRNENRLLVEQTAVVEYMMFSRRIRLLLDVEQRDGSITFSDRSQDSFARYEGAWTVTAAPGGAQIEYRLAAKPLFKAPAFLMKRVLRRDAKEMIARLQAEIETRGRKGEAKSIASQSDVTYVTYAGAWAALQPWHAPNRGVRPGRDARAIAVRATGSREYIVPSREAFPIRIGHSRKLHSVPV